jgi:hypothetical protein
MTDDVHLVTDDAHQQMSMMVTTTGSARWCAPWLTSRSRSTLPDRG